MRGQYIAGRMIDDADLAAVRHLLRLFLMWTEDPQEMAEVRRVLVRLGVRNS